MTEILWLPEGIDGRVVRQRRGEVRARPHRHAELELNLMVAGTATYLLGQRRYELRPGTLTWLFSGQEHVLVDRSPDHELWWAVFTPGLVASTVGTDAHPLREANPAGTFSRPIDSGSARRLLALFSEVRDATDRALANAGLSYLLVLAWRMFVDSDGATDAVDLHPAVAHAVRLLNVDPNTHNLAQGVGLSRTHLSRLFAAQTGMSLTRYRNQQRLHRFVLNRDQHSTTLAAALAAGFGSYAQFYRVFRDETGHAPNEPDQSS